MGHPIWWCPIKTVVSINPVVSDKDGVSAERGGFCN